MQMQTQAARNVTTTCRSARTFQQASAAVHPYPATPPRTPPDSASPAKNGTPRVGWITSSPDTTQPRRAGSLVQTLSAGTTKIRRHLTDTHTSETIPLDSLILRVSTST